MTDGHADALATPRDDLSEAAAEDGPRTDTRVGQALRTVVTFVSFAMFFTGSVLLGLLFVPVFLPLALFNLKRYRALCTGFVAWGLGTFIYWLRLVRLLTYEMPVPPPELGDGPYVVVANHPTMIDVPFMLHSFPRLTSVVKWRLWSRMADWAMC